MACAVFKTVGRRHRRLRWVRFPSAPAIALAACCLGQLPAGSLRRAEAQIPVPRPGLPTPRPDTGRADTVPVPQFRYPPPVAPLAAMARSLVLPGWGQAVLHRRLTGGLFVFWEGLAAAMTIKAANQLHYLEATGGTAEAVRLKRQEVQDWAVVWIFNHLMAGAEAFVSAELWDFPGELQARTLPEGRLAVGTRFYWPR